MRYLYLLLFSMGLHLLAAQQIKFSAETDTNKISIGEQFHLVLKAEIPASTNYQWPLFPDTVSGLEIVDITPIDSQEVGELIKLQQTLTLTSFDSGYIAIPPLQLKAGNAEEISAALGIAVLFPELSEEQDYYDIKEPLEPPFSWQPYLIGAAIVLVLALLIWLLIRWLKKRKQTAGLSVEEKLSPYEYAQLQLREIEGEKLYQNGRIKEYYSRLTDVVRLYLEREKNMNAMESTADELIEKMQSLPLSTEMRSSMNELVQKAALVKYARHKPQTVEHEMALRTVKEFLEECKPQQDVEVSV